MGLNFLNLGIRKEIVKPLEEAGITEPTPVQEKVIPVALLGKDIMAQAQTGTGKTFAFLLPILEHLDPNEKKVQALILAPTRELALQITTEARKIAERIHINVLAVYGGQDVEKQIHKLKGGMHLVVATPGRLLDHLRRETIDLSNTRFLVLDEADQMLDMGFLEEVEVIIRKTSPNRQTMLFSATLPKQIRGLAKKYMNNIEEVRIKSERVTLDEIQQLVVETTDRHKQAALKHMLREYNPFLAIVFCRTKRRAKALNEALVAEGYLSDELHGDMTQAKREKVMKAFREAKLQILVATDVVARGIDVEGVTHIFNYDIPQDVESYIHRIGRTGRAGEAGMAITFLAPKDRDHLNKIEKGINQSIARVTYEPEGRAESMEATFAREARNKESNRKESKLNKQKESKKDHKDFRYNKDSSRGRNKSKNSRSRSKKP